MAGSGGSSGQNKGGSNTGKAKSSVARVSPNGRREVGEPTVPVTSSGVTPTSSAPVKRKFFTRRNIFLIIGGIVLLVVVGVGVYMWNEVNKSLPTISGNAQLPGLSANVT